MGGFSEKLSDFCVSYIVSESQLQDTPLLANAKSISNSGSCSVKTYLRRKNNKRTCWGTVQWRM